MTNQTKKRFDLKAMIFTLWDNRRLMTIHCIIALVLGLVFAISMPKSYSVGTTLVPEAASVSGLSSIASMMGVNLGTADMVGDAIDPSMFPDISTSLPFLMALSESPIHTSEDTTTITVRQYCKEEYMPWYAMIAVWKDELMERMRNAPTVTMGEASEESRILTLSGKEQRKLLALSKHIKVTQNMKTGVVTIVATFQDPVATTMIADACIDRLQEAIYSYKTTKARSELRDLQVLEEKRRAEYERRQQEYAAYLGSNRNANNYVITAEKDRLDAEMTLAYQALQQVTQQRYISEQTLLEKKPSYALLDPPALPIEPNSSRKMVVVVWLFMGFVVSALWILYIRKYIAKAKQLIRELKQRK